MDRPNQQSKSISEGIDKTNPDLKAERLNMSLWVTNETNTQFVFENCQLDWGKWMESPRNIPANSSRILSFRSCGRIGTPAGTEGWVRYSADQRRAKFIVRWDIPYSGAGYLTVSCEGEGCDGFVFEVTHYDPRSNDPNPLLTIKSRK